MGSVHYSYSCLLFRSRRILPTRLERAKSIVETPQQDAIPSTVLPLREYEYTYFSGDDNRLLGVRCLTRSDGNRLVTDEYY